MEKIKSLMASPSFTLCLIALYLIRFIILGASVGDALSFLSLCALNGYCQWHKAKEFKPLSDQVRKEVDEMKSAIAVMGMKNIKSTSKPEDIKQGRFF